MITTSLSQTKSHHLLNHIVIIFPICTIHSKLNYSNSAPLYPLQDFKALYKYCIIIIIQPYLDFKIANTTAISTIHSKLNYSNSLNYELLKSQINQLQQIQNSLIFVVSNIPKSSHILPIPHSLHWLNVNEHSEHKFLSFTHKVLMTTQRTLSPKLDLYTTHLQHLLLVCCCPCKTTYVTTDHRHRLLLSTYIHSL